MPIRIPRRWDLPDRLATPEAVFRDRRRLVKAMGLGGLIAGTAPLLALGGCDSEPIAYEPDPSASLYPVARNARYAADRDITAESEATTYINFYEFGSHKNVARPAQALKLRPWEIRIDGMVERPFAIAIDELLAKMPLEERVYRHRCVEAWSMTVPWSGFPLRALLDMARPLGGAKYVVMETFRDPSVARGQNQSWYPWPYVEGLTMAEAANDLAFVATGLYGKPILKQNGAPLRLVVPWKYGFKSVKSIVRFHFADRRPKTFWEAIQPSEYGFWANVNPAVPHPRWSQASERVLGKGNRVPTLLFNGYGDFVADLYKGLDGERLYA